MTQENKEPELIEPVNADANKKNAKFEMRITSDQKRRIKEFAKASGMTGTDYGIYCMLKEPPRIKIATLEREFCIRQNAEVGRIGSNVNQIAKVMHTVKKTHYSVAVKEEVIVRVMTSIENYIDFMTNYLTNGGTWENQGKRPATGELPPEERG